ncbi:hypothetical protein ISCGN_011461 [Ixodes scapularis]
MEGMEPSRMASAWGYDPASMEYSYVDLTQQRPPTESHGGAEEDPGWSTQLRKRQAALKNPQLERQAEPLKPQEANLKPSQPARGSRRPQAASRQEWTRHRVRTDGSSQRKTRALREKT